MSVCYDKLWKLLIDKKMNRTELKEASGISFNVLARLGKNEPVSFDTIEKICFTLDCKIEDVVEIKNVELIKVEKSDFTTIELFAGAGGLALGIEKAKFKTLGLIEFDRDAAESLRTNRPEWRVINDDIANISCLDLEEYFGIKKGELDLLSGGAPCQAFSYAGKRLGLEDARGTLFYHYATFLQKLQPKMFLFENVRGLLTHDKGRTYTTITSIFEQAGYTIQKKVLNAWDFGVPQKRERLITIGIRNDLLDEITFSFPQEHEYKPVLRDVLLDCPEGPGVPYGENKRKIFELVPPGGYWRDIDPEIAKAYRGAVTTDRYGRKMPKHAHGTVNLKGASSSSKVILEAVMDLFDRIVNPKLLVRRIYVTANHVADEKTVSMKTEFEQMNLFVDYAAREAEQKAESERLARERKLQEVSLAIKKKFGKNAILKGMNLEEGATARQRNSQIGGHKA